MSDRTPQILIAAGGTGGHILPGIRIGEQIEGDYAGAYRVQYVCGSRDIEARIYESESIKPLKLRCARGSRVGALISFTGDFVRVMRMFLRDRPAAVLAMGGAVCVPVLVAAIILRVPIFLHESNRIPGRVVRLFAPFAKRVFLGLGGLERKNSAIVGTPTRPVDSATERSVVICMGGSQGAKKLNEAFIAVANKDHIRKLGYQFILLSGVGKGIGNTGTVEVREYEPRMETLLARAELIISRAGAGSLADIANWGIPSILVPYPFAKDNHQKANAETFANADAAIMLEESSLTDETLAATVRALLNDSATRKRMRENLVQFDSSRSAEVIARQIVGCIENSKSRVSHSMTATVPHESR